MTKNLEVRFCPTHQSRDQLKADSTVRTECLELAVELDGLIPDGNEKDQMFNHLEEVMLWANAGLARD